MDFRDLFLPPHPDPALRHLQLIVTAAQARGTCLPALVAILLCKDRASLQLITGTTEGVQSLAMGKLPFMPLGSLLRSCQGLTTPWGLPADKPLVSLWLCMTVSLTSQPQGPHRSGCPQATVTPAEGREQGAEAQGLSLPLLGPTRAGKLNSAEEYCFRCCYCQASLHPGMNHIIGKSAEKQHGRGLGNCLRY